MNVRHLESCAIQVLSAAGSHGIFAEPRSLDAKEASTQFQVIWLPRMSLDEVLHLVRCNADITGAARMGSRLGIRVEVAKTASVSARVRPDHVVLELGKRSEFEMGPLPFGLDRTGVQSLCKTLKWSAKPINPIRTLANELGVMWLLHAVVDPPSNVIQTKHGEVLISKVPAKTQSNSTGSSSVVISPATATVCAATATPASDPWLQRDPWQGGSQKFTVSKPVVADAVLQLKDVEQRLEQSILSKLQTNMETDEVDTRLTQVQKDTDARLQVLEQQVQAIGHRHASLEQQVHDNAAQSKAQISQLQHHVSAQLDSQSTQIQTMFQDQMQNIERLLKKRSSME